MNAAATPVYRGTADGARCEDCPFSSLGMPNKPVFSEFAEDPMWLYCGEGPGRTEVMLRRPFVGPTGQVVEQILHKIGRPRAQLGVLNATLCMPTPNSNEQDRHRAAEACRPRLMRELAQFPGKPMLTLGAVAARSIIPKEVLDAIDPPDTPKEIKKQQKLKQQPTKKNELAKQKKIGKLAEKRLKKMLSHRAKQLTAEYRKVRRAKPDKAWLMHELSRNQARMALKAKRDAVLEYDVWLKEQQFKKEAREQQKRLNPKPKKPKPIKITDIVGTTFRVDVDGSGVRCVVPAIHPAALLRGGGASIGGSHTPDLAFINIIYDAVKVDSIARGKDIWLNFDNVEIEWEHQERAERLFLDIFREAMEEGEVALDLETYVDEPDRHSALMAYVAKIRSIGLATSKRAVSVYWDLLPAWCHTYLNILFNSVILTTHNGLYDRTVLRAYGFKLPAHLFEDTLLAHHAAFPGNAHRLQVVTAQFYGVEPWKSEFRNAEETPEKLTLYNAKDTYSTRRLRSPLAIHIKRNKVEKVYELDKKMAECASRMHLAGMPVNRDINTTLLNTFSKNVQEARRAVEDTARDPKLREQIWHHLALQQAQVKRKLDPDDFEERYQVRLNVMKQDPDWKWKIGAGKHIAALLLAMGVGLYQTTEAGQISTKKDVLESLVDVPIIRDILNFRENDKLLSTFIWQIFDRTVGGEIVQYGYADWDDRIHPIWSVHKISGRWASRWPVVSNVPKDKWKKLVADALAQIMGLTVPEKGQFTNATGQIFRVNKDGSISKMTRPNLRAQIRARPGRKLVGFDFSQLEARGIALVSGDPFLLDVFSKGLDIHRECARVIFAGFDQMDPDSQKQVREQTKPMEYGAFYGGSVETLHKQMLKEGYNVKLVDVAKAVETLMRKMAGVVKWQHDTVRIASSPPFELRDIIVGRRRVWPMGNVEPSEAMNIGIQSLGSGIMNEGMARMMDELDKYKEAEPIAQIHDAAVFECWEDDAEAIAADIDRVFPTQRERDGRTINFPVETKIGDSWDKV